MNVEKAAEVREQLKPFRNRRIEVEGTISQIGSCWDHNLRRQVPSLCVKNLEIRSGDHPVVDHVWVIFAGLMLQTGVREGDTVRFTAQVYQYRWTPPNDPNRSVERLGLREPRDVVCLNRQLKPEELELARFADQRTREAIDEGRMTKEDETADGPDSPPAPEPPPPVPPPDPRRALFDAVLRLVEAHGADRVRKTLAAVETLLQE